MSEENVELVRRWHAWLPDLRDLDPADDDAVADRAFRDYLDESFELRLPDYPDGEPIFRGREGLSQWIERLRGVWAEWRFEPERFIEASDRVVVLVKIVARGNSGVPVEMPTAHVVTLHGGRIASARAYRHGTEALEAVGLEP